MSRDSTTGKKADELHVNMLERQQRLNKLQEFLLGAGSLDEKMKAVTEQIVEMLKASFCRIWIIKPGDLCDAGCIHSKATEEPYICHYRDRCLHLVASSGRYVHIDGDHRRVPFGCYKIGRIASEEASKFLTNDVRHDHHIHDREWAGEIGLVSFAGYQLQDPERKSLGVLALFSKHKISTEDDLLLEGISNTTAQVIQAWWSRESLRREKEFAETALNSQRDTFFVFNPSNGKAMRWNTAFNTVTGYRDDEISMLKAPDSYYSPEDLKKAAGIMKGTIEGEPYMVELDLITKSGEKIPFEYNGNVISGETAGEQYIVAIGRDMTERKKNEEALLREKQKLEEVTGYANCGLFLLDDRTRVVYANSVAEKWFGPFEQIKGTCCYELFRLKDPENECSALKVLRTGEAGSSEAFVELASGEEKYFYETASPLKDSKGRVYQITAVVTDITERRQMEDRLRTALEEKEVLLREVHHRVKNNFQVITSILRLQGKFIHDEQLLEVFRDSENRIRSMAIVHERLYQSGDLSNINSGDFMKSLALEMLRSYGSRHRMTLETDIEKVMLPVETAIPCGMIIGELIANSIKHAFPESGAGIIRLDFHKITTPDQDGYEYELTVGDNGIGTPEDMDIEKNCSMGLTLVRSMVERQLFGKMDIAGHGGTISRIRFGIAKLQEHKNGQDKAVQ